VFGRGERVGRKDVALADRNRQIAELIRQGVSYQAIGDKFGISKQRVAQLNQESQEEVPDDARREGQLALLEHVISENMRKLREPPPATVNARGVVYEKLRDDSGRPVFGSKGQPLDDFTRPIPDARYHLEVQDRVFKGIELAAKLGGWARLKARTVDQDEEMKQFLSELERTYSENEELRKKVAALSRNIIEAEVIHDDPPATAG
jgi:hypothetical protein